MDEDRFGRKLSNTLGWAPDSICLGNGGDEWVDKGTIKIRPSLPFHPMPPTYRAILKGTQVIWLDTPPQLPDDTEINITILSHDAISTPSHSARAMAASLCKLAELNPLPNLDPVEWQRETRQDRPLPDRDEFR